MSAAPADACKFPQMMEVPADARNPVRIRISALLSNDENHDLR